MAHWLDIVGLVFNMGGTLLLLLFPPKVLESTADGLRLPGGGATRADDQ
jgi:hypothetical protein